MAMQTSLFSFDLPERLVAQSPPEHRGDSRLMVLDRNRPISELDHRMVHDLPDLVEPGTLMIFNDTKVRKARVFAVNADTGGKGEFLFLHTTARGEWDCVVDKAKKKRLGQKWNFPGGVVGEITGSPDRDRRLVRLDPEPTDAWFEAYGHVPLPPYMRRSDIPDDVDRYQTVYAKDVGSAAAPTAGLHFTEGILAELENKGVELAWVTLKVGLGTFSPIRVDNIRDHPMHTEEYTVPEATSAAVARAKKHRRKVLAVGTTSVRTLEAAWNGTNLEAGSGSTNLFIYPGYDFQVVDLLFTNFHTPKSSLLMLVSAFAGRERILEAYGEAIRKEYRFFSYGDAMLIR